MLDRVKAHKWAEQNIDLVRDFEDTDVMTWLNAARLIGAKKDCLHYILKHLSNVNQDKRRRIWCSVGVYLEHGEELLASEILIDGVDSVEIKKRIGRLDESLFKWIGYLLAEITAVYNYCSIENVLVTQKDSKKYFEIDTEEKFIPAKCSLHELNKQRSILDYFEEKCRKLEGKIEESKNKIKVMDRESEILAVTKMKGMELGLKNLMKSKSDIEEYMNSRSSTIYIKPSHTNLLEPWSFASLIAGLSPFQVWNCYQIPLDHLITGLIGKAVSKDEPAYVINLPIFLLAGIEEIREHDERIMDEVKEQINKCIVLLHEMNQDIFNNDTSGFAHQVQFEAKLNLLVKKFGGIGKSE